MVLNKLNSYQTRSLPLIFGNTFIIINNYSNLLKLALNTEIESVHYLLKEHEFIKLKSMEMELKFARTTIEMAVWLLNFPIYITDNMCARLSLYPVEHWISRTSGVLKHLLCDYNSITLTVKGLISLMQTYYACDKNSSKSLDIYIYILSNHINDNNSSKNIKLLYNFFHNNYLDFTRIKNTLYFMHLHMELIKSEKTNKIDVNIELDQTANLINPKKSCPYTFVMSYFEEFASNFMTNLDKTAIIFLKSSRKLHKYALMCYTYNQTHLGRRIQTLSYNEEIKTLNEFAVKYNDFVELLNKKKLELLNKAVILAANTTGKTFIATLEREILTRSFYKSTKLVRHKFNPSTMTSQSYRLNAIQSNKNLNITAHKNKFFSYLIHSIKLQF